MCWRYSTNSLYLPFPTVYQKYIWSLFLIFAEELFFRNGAPPWREFQLFSYSANIKRSAKISYWIHASGLHISINHDDNCNSHLTPSPSSYLLPLYRRLPSFIMQSVMVLLRRIIYSTNKCWENKRVALLHHEHKKTSQLPHRISRKCLHPDRKSRNWLLMHFDTVHDPSRNIPFYAWCIVLNSRLMPLFIQVTFKLLNCYN